MQIFFFLIHQSNQMEKKKELWLTGNVKFTYIQQSKQFNINNSDLLNSCSPDSIFLLQIKVLVNIQKEGRFAF